MSKIKKNEVVQVEVSELTKKGNGLGKVQVNDDVVRIAEVPFAIPGDTVRARVNKYRRGRAHSSLEEVLNLSSDRQDPKCKHFGICGGCRWQQMSYDKQLEHKDRYVWRCFEHLVGEDVEKLPIVGSTPVWNYRNKMEFSFSMDSKGEKYLGLVMASGKGRVANVTECHLVTPWFTDVLGGVRQWWEESNVDAYHLYKDKGALRTLTLREGKRTGDRLVMLTVSGNPEYAMGKQQLENFVAAVRRCGEPADANSKLSIFLRIHQISKGMPTNFYEMLLYGPDHIREVLEVQVDPSEEAERFFFHVSPTAFFQPNPYQAEVLYSKALQLAGVKQGDVVYDLYCGTGTLGICSARRAKKVVGIEVSPESALDAKTNASLNGLDNVTIVSGAVRHVLSQLLENGGEAPDLVVLDPPRAGLDPEAMEGLIELNAARILYISCNPESQAFDIERIIKHGYRLIAMQAVDQFPHTPHIENIVVLEKD